MFFLLFAIQPAIARDFDSYFDDMESRIRTEIEIVGTGTNQVSNSIKIDANTGGNRAESGQIVNGEATSKSTVKTTVNGEVVEDNTIIEKNNTGNASLEIEAYIEVNEQEEPKIEIITKVNDEVVDEGDIKINEKDLKSEEQIRQVLAGENVEEVLPEAQTETSSPEPETLNQAEVDEKDKDVEIDDGKEINEENESTCSTEGDLCPPEPVVNISEAVDNGILDWIQEFVEMVKNKLKDILESIQ